MTNTRLQDYQYILVVDLEATCDDGFKQVPRHEMEIIEIGAVMVNSQSLAPVDEFQSFIKPVRHPQLTQFCTQLTSISQSDIDQAPGYAEVIQRLSDWLAGYPGYIFCSWGDYDKNQFRKDSEYHGVNFPFGSGHINIKKLFARSQSDGKPVGMAKALKKVGLKLDGHHHRGIDDARNMVKLLPFMTSSTAG